MKTAYDSRYGSLDDWAQFGSDADYHRQPALQYEDAIAREGCAAFRAAYGKPLSEKNAQALLDWVKQRNAPATRKNLEIAFRVLRHEGKLREDKPAEQAAIGKLITNEVRIRPIQAAQVAGPTDDEQVILDKTKDDSSLSDHARKQRDEKLKRAATASRLANRRHDPNKTNRRILIS